MNNVIILGSGRSGTSMLAGMLRNSGYYLGDNYLSPRAANPKGFFEDREVNEINDKLIRSSLENSAWQRLLRRFGRGQIQRPPWLCALNAPLPGGKRGSAAMMPHIETAKQLVSRQPFCYKDPRFSYTLPVWKPLLPENTRYVVVFRHPVTTAESILRELAETPSPRGRRLGLTVDGALHIWKCMYDCVFQAAKNLEQYQFVHFDQLLSGVRTKQLEQFLGAPVDAAFAERAIPRSERKTLQQLPRAVDELYAKLCHHAGFELSTLQQRGQVFATASV